MKKKRTEGFSIVEVLVSMVILSIVMLVLTNVTMVSTLEHGNARQKDVGSRMAREKLTQLQDPSQMVVDGDTTVEDLGITYDISWTIDNTQTPPLATVTVSWVKDGRDRTTQVAGYIESGNVCVTPSSNNAPAIELYDDSHTLIADGDPVTIHLNPGADAFVCRVVGTDPDIADGDIPTVTIVDNVGEADKFHLSNTGDTLLTTVNLGGQGSSYSVQLHVEDCAGLDEYRNVTIMVGAADNTPHVDDLTLSGSVNENSISTSLGTITAAGSDPLNGADIVWSTSDPNVDIDAVTGDMELKSTASIDFEAVGATYTFAVTATRDSDDSTADVSFTVTDVNEAPLGLKNLASPYTITEAQGLTDGYEVVTLEGADPDSNSANAGWGTVSFWPATGTSTHFTIHNSGKITVNGSAAVGDHDVKVLVKDTEGLSSVAQTVTVTVSSSGSGSTQDTTGENTGSSGVDCSDVDAFVVWTGGAQVLYNGGFGGATPSKVTYGGVLYEGNSSQYQWYNSDGVPSVLTSYWDEIGECN